MSWRNLVDASLRDLRHTSRSLLKRPAFAATIVLTLGLGLGSTVAIFSVVNGVLLEPLPYPDADRLVSVSHAAPGIDVDNLGSGAFLYFTEREETQAFESVGAWGLGGATVTGVGEPEEIRRLLATAELLPLLGVQPMIGRHFSAEDDVPDSNPTVILSYAYWQRRFGGDAAILGRSITMDGQPRTIIGVMPQGFRVFDRSVDAIYPYRLDRNRATVGAYSLDSVARLKPGFSLEQANADVNRMIPLAIDRFPLRPGVSREQIERSGLRANVRPLKDVVVANAVTTLWVLLACAALVPMIACANVANLLLARAEWRQRELAIRTALGASRSGIGRTAVTESALLSFAGGAVGLALAYAAIEVLRAVDPPYLPRLEDISVDSTVLLFALALTALATLLCGSMPLLRASRGALGSLLHTAGRISTLGRGSSIARGTLIVAQLALVTVLLVGAGLMARTARELASVDPGFARADELQTFFVGIPRLTQPDLESAIRMQHAMLDRLARIPGVTNVAYTSSLPLEVNPMRDGVVVAESIDDGAEARLRPFKFVSPGSFLVMGTPLIAGRDVTWTDVYEKRAVVVISESFARAEWGSTEAALGKRIRSTPTTDQWREVIGIAGDVRDLGPNQPDPGTVYVPILAERLFNNPLNGSRDATFLVRTSRAGTASLLEEIRAAVWSIDANLPLSRVRTLADVWDDSLARTLLTQSLLAIAGALALALGIVGVYSVIAYSVAQRARDIGIRVALGAQAPAISAMFVQRGFMLALIGVTVGLGGGVALGRGMRSLLFGVSTTDPLTYGAVAVMLMLVAIAASYIPARRAAQIDPVRVLRADS
jgi:predicted permease